MTESLTVTFPLPNIFNYYCYFTLSLLYILTFWQTLPSQYSPSPLLYKLPAPVRIWTLLEVFFLDQTGKYYSHYLAVSPHELFFSSSSTSFPLTPSTHQAVGSWRSTNQFHSQLSSPSFILCCQPHPVSDRWIALDRPTSQILKHSSFASTGFTIVYSHCGP